MATSLTPPVAPVEVHTSDIHGHRLEDPYAWVRNREDPRVLELLRAENAYTDAENAHLEPLRQQLYQEFLGRIKEDDETVPTPEGEFVYYRRTEAGKAYWVGCRRPRGGGEEEVLLDVNQLAEGHEFMNVAAYYPSPDGRLLTYATDTTGYRRFDLVVKDLATGDLLPERLENISPDVEWAADSRSFWYVRHDDALRSHQVWWHRAGEDPAGDRLVFEERDEVFSVGMARSDSKRFVFIGSSSATTSEVRYLPRDDPAGEPRLIEPRRPGIRYSVEDQGERFLVLTDDAGRNFRLAEAPIATPGADHWRELVAHREDVMLESVSALRDHIVLTERARGLLQLRVEKLSTGEVHRVEFPEPVYTAYKEFHEYDSARLRYLYTSLTTPISTFEYDLETRQSKLLKEQEIPSGYDKSQYVTERIWATAPDGVQVPISLVRRADSSGPRPLYMTAYGSYGFSSDPIFSANWISYLDRGVTCALAHVRGGGDLGEAWRLDGKLLKKKNTFTDFIACAEHLIAAGYTAADKLAVQGGSAGGLLMGAVVNMRPDLFHAVIARVPFVDVINTMLDASIPLTVPEYEEWGNPNEPEFFEYMLSYSPYDNVAPQEYPAILATAGWNDSQVHYWEPAKWVAKLRATATGRRPLHLRSYLETGHGGPSGRYDALRESAWIAAWTLDQLDLE